MKNNEYIGKICPFCKTIIKEGEAVKVCDVCGIPHHQECWDENNGCSTFGCSEQHYEAQGTRPMSFCSNCGGILEDGQEFCPKCGTPKNAPKLNVCGKCGAELHKDQEFCPKCGQKAGLAVDPSITTKIEQFNTATTKKKKKALVPIIVSIAVVIVIVLIGSFGSGANLKKVFNEIGGDDIYSTSSSDGSCLQIDTNPYDLDDTFSNTAWQMIAYANEVLGLPDSLEVKMGETRAMDGRQTMEYDKVIVSWTYHPDQGMEVMYEEK